MEERRIYHTLIDRINEAVKQNKGQPGTYAISLSGKLLFGFSQEDSKNPAEAYDNLKKQGYKRKRFIFQTVLNPKKTYIFDSS